METINEKILGIIGSFLLLIGFFITMYLWLDIGLTGSIQMTEIETLFFIIGFGIFITGQILFGLVIYSIFKKTDNKSYVSNYTMYAILWDIGLILPTIFDFIPKLNFTEKGMSYTRLFVIIIAFILLLVASWYYNENLHSLSRLTNIGNFKNSGLLWTIGIGLIFIFYIIEEFIVSTTGTKYPMEFIGMIFVSIALILQIISCAFIPKELIKVKIS